MSTQQKESALIEFRTEIRKLQLSSRSLPDIENGLATMPELLRRVSHSLGHIVDPSFYTHPAAVHTFKLEDTPKLMSGVKERKYLDMYMRRWQVFSDIKFHMDETISFCTIMNDMRELGITYDSSHRAEWPGERNEMLVYFSPAKWPFIAAELILDLYGTEDSHRGVVVSLMKNVYKGTGIADLETMLSSGLCDDPTILCDWLIMNESKTQISQPSTQAELPVDL